MEKVTYSENHTAIERFLLTVYSIYSITIISLTERAGWGNKLNILLVTGLMLAWIIHAANVKDYYFRAKITAVLMQISIVFYAMCAEDIVRALPTFLVFAIVLGLYGIPGLATLPFVSTAVVFIYHAFIAKTISFSSGDDIIKIISQIANLILAECVIYIWTKRNREGSDQLMGVIEELRVAESSKDDFVANVSHEIRTPINTICGMCEIILKEELPYKVKENVISIQTAGRNLMEVVSDILDFSELQSGKIELEEEAYNITSTINDVINMAMAKKNDKNIELIVDCDATMPSVLMGDEKKLRRIIMNLVDNAVKFTEEGCVSLRIGHRREEYGINLVVSVKDTGIGISERNLERIFTSFSQVDAGRSRQEGGLGLGLSISSALIKKMGGAITIKSKLRKGTIVQVVIPQKVLDGSPIATLEDRQAVKVATYIDMEQFDMMAIRDEYTAMILGMVEQLKGRCHICRNLAELQRRESAERFTHIFISIPEYKEDKEYFDALSKKTKVVIILDRLEEKEVDNPYLLKIYKPFYILSIVSVLNAMPGQENGGYRIVGEKFTTQNVRVLVVDDNRMNLLVVRELLEGYNIDVTTATGGMEALSKIEKADYDFVFMDYMMPEMDGIETLRNIRQKVGTYFAKIPVIALTANAVAGTRELLLGAGFNDFMEKPIERSVLERVLKRNIPIEKIIYSQQDLIVEREEEMQMPEAEATEDYGISALTLIDGLDVDQGILYCNGKEAYLEILRAYCEDWEGTGALATDSYAKKDWKNYTIAVHGLKSALFSIGANRVSEMAKQLEFAGKENRISYIEEHHEELMDEYSSLFKQLLEVEAIFPKKEIVKDEATDLEELPMDKLDKIIEDMENAVYAFDRDILLKIVEELERYCYKGNTMKTVLEPVRRKIEMSDFMSAVEMITKWKEDLDSKENS